LSLPFLVMTVLIRRDLTLQMFMFDFNQIGSLNSSKNNVYKLTKTLNYYCKPRIFT